MIWHRWSNSRSSEVAESCDGCGNDSASTRFENEEFAIAHAGDATTIAGLSGYRCNACGEVIFDPASAARYAAAGDVLVVQQRASAAREIRRIRRKLGVTQTEAARLTGGDHYAFSCYERGEAAPVQAVLTLFRLLDRHPELLREIA